MNRIIIFLYSLLMFLVPLIFFTGTSEIFEFNKMILVYSFTVLITSSWIIKMITQKRIIFNKSFADIPILLFLLSQIISTLLSIDIRTSVFGYYSRFNGGLMSSISYALLYWGYVNNVDSKHTKKFVQVFIITAVIAAVWGVLEHFGMSISCVFIKGELNSNCWVQDIQNRVFATFGQPNWMAGFLAAALPLAWIVKSNKSKFIISALFFSALLFTKSRSGMIGFAVANVIYWFITLKIDFKSNLKNMLLINAVFVLLFIVTDSPWRSTLINKIAPSDQHQELTSLIPLDETGGTESGDIRKIVWQGAVGVWKKYPLFGSGPETFAYSYYFARPLAHNNTSEWNYVYNKAHNEYLNYLATSGVIGLASYLIMIFSFSMQIYNSKLQIRYSLLAGFVSLLVTNFFGFSVVPTQVLIFMFPAMAVSLGYSAKKQISFKLLPSQKIASAFVVLIAFLMLILISRYWYADYLYAKAKSDNDNGSLVQALENINNALVISPYEPVYLSQLADVYLSIATVANNKNDPLAITYLEKADSISEMALDKTPYNLKLIRAAAGRYSDMAEIKQDYLYKEEKWIEYAAEIAPTDAGVWYQYALVKTKLGENNLALELTEKTIQMRPMYKNARRLAAFLYEKEGNIKKSQENLEYILKYISPNDEAVKNKLEELQDTK